MPTRIKKQANGPESAGGPPDGRPDQTPRTRRSAIGSSERSASDGQDRLLRVPEVCSITGLGRRTVWRLISAGQIRTVRMAGTSAVRVKLSEVNSYVARSEAASA